MAEFISDLAAVRERARQSIGDGAVTGAYQADREQVIKVLNDALATELVCILRYKRHYFMARGISSDSVKAEFLEHAGEEQQHADWIAERITQLGGAPNFSPVGLADRSHSEYAPGTNLQSMIQEDLIAERVAIQIYSDVIRWLGDADPTTRKLIVDILKVEEEHADDMANLLIQLT